MPRPPRSMAPTQAAFQRRGSGRPAGLALCRDKAQLRADRAHLQPPLSGCRRPGCGSSPSTARGAGRTWRPICSPARSSPANRSRSSTKAGWRAISPISTTSSPARSRRMTARRRCASGVPHRIYNLGNHRPEKLLDFIAVLERVLGRTAQKGAVADAARRCARKALPISKRRAAISASSRRPRSRSGSRDLCNGTSSITTMRLIGAIFMERGFAVIGLGYVGLPVALALAKKFEPVIGFDISQRRIARPARWRGHDRRGHRGGAARDETSLDRRSRRAGRGELLHRHRADADRCRPPPRPLAAGRRLRTDRPALRPGSVVVFESTVYPGLTREICGPLPRRGLGAAAGRSISSSATRPSASTPATSSTGSRRSSRSSPARTRRPWSASPRSMRGIVDGRRPPRAFDRGRRGGQGHREHPARPQHRADERAGDHLRPARHPDHATCCRRPARNGTSCRSRRAWSAATASASIPIT